MLKMLIAMKRVSCAASVYGQAGHAWPPRQARRVRRTLTSTVADTDSCRWCGGRGWKFLTLRRAPANAVDAGEVAMLKRPRVTCIACGGTGSAGTGSPRAAGEAP